MAESSSSSTPFPKPVEEIFREYCGRRNALIRALTEDVNRFYSLCDPDNEILCLYGYPNGTWEVSPPDEFVPQRIPEPCNGINFARDGGMKRVDWISLVAIHCDCWLVAVAFFYGGYTGLSRADRSRLFNMINDLPDVFEVVRDSQQPAEDKPGKDYSCEASGTRTRSFIKRSSVGRGKQLRILQENDRCGKQKVVEASDGRGKQKMAETSDGRGKQKMAEASDGRGKQKMAEASDDRGKQKMVEESDVQNEEDEEQETLCGHCNGVYSPYEFWIACDVCLLWYHGRCVGVTQTQADSIGLYECPFCRRKRNQS